MPAPTAMIPYPWLRAALFRLPPERAHRLGIAVLRGLGRRSRWFVGPPPQSPCEVMGLRFRNPVGLAAGWDDNAEAIAGLAGLGFGFLEVGTVTPRAQAGNPQPRLFRLAKHRALINRLGFANQGVSVAVARLGGPDRPAIPIGLNLGKNRSTPLEEALEDYRIGLQIGYPQADYFTVNISSPNTPGLRDLQHPESLHRLLGGLREERDRLAAQHGPTRPLVVKLAPDLEPAELDAIARVMRDVAIDGIITTNTTQVRDPVVGHRHAHETGGLSGAPLRDRATAVLAGLHERLEGEIPLIAAGGVDSAAAAIAKRTAGAQLVQVYTGLIYRGPALIREITRAWGTSPHPAKEA